jgi:metal-responsive CopG/Arc/MetJ family transcriptional regulator
MVYTKRVTKKPLSAKLDEALLEKVDRLARKLHVPRNRAIEEGLALWIKEKSRELLAKEMEVASHAVRKESLLSAREWDFSLEDDPES